MKLNKDIITNIEFLLLEFIFNRKEISGYSIDQEIKKKKIREWMNIGTTSIYLSLKKLKQKKFIKSKINHNKKGKGGLPIIYKITEKGKRFLEKELIKVLSGAYESDVRFDIALLESSLVPSTIKILSLKKRKQILIQKKSELESMLSAIDMQNFESQLLINHKIDKIGSEINFVDKLIEIINGIEKKIKREKRITTSLIAK